jgi:hypothetical protein
VLVLVLYKSLSIILPIESMYIIYNTPSSLQALPTGGGASALHSMAGLATCVLGRYIVPYVSAHFSTGTSFQLYSLNANCVSALGFVFG